jgi:hypothetical protein
VQFACSLYDEAAKALPVAFCRWYHLKKPKWVQDLPFANIVMRPWMPTYFRIMGVLLCLFALGLVWIVAT